MRIAVVGPVGMILVAVAAVIYWRRVSRLPLKWFWAGAGLWAVAVALKLLCARLTMPQVIEFMKENLSQAGLVIVGGAFVGIESSLFEMGLTLLAVLIWRQLGRDAERSIAVGVGAGAFEALLLGAVGLIALITVLAGVPGTEKLAQEMEKVAARTPVFWLAAPAERIIAILCHASCRALILLGAARRRAGMILAGFVIFALLDGVVGAFHVSGKIGVISIWWVELAILPLGLLSIPILRRCYLRWRRKEEEPLPAGAE